MGLDMYLKGKKFLRTNWDKPKENQKEDGFPLKEKILDLGYWRKHPNLHGYIVQNYAEDGQDDCKEIPLNKKALEKINSAIKHKKLPETQGFFFGESDGTETERDLEIFQKAVEWMEGCREGECRDVVYQASW